MRSCIQGILYNFSLMDTIDLKVLEVIQREKSKLSKEEELLAQKLAEDLLQLPSEPKSNYTIAPKDTIGKSIIYNISSK